jgi:hypothetical protein
MFRALVVLFIFSPLWLLLPIAIWRIRKEHKRDVALYDHGSDIGISANYWAD